MKSVYIKTALIIVIASVTFQIFGCRNNKEKSASKSIKQALTVFADTGDLDRVEQILRSAPREQAGEAIDITNAAVKKAKATKIKDQMAVEKNNIFDVISNIKNSVLKHNELIARKEKILGAIKSRKKTIEIMQYGNDDAIGLEGLKKQKESKQKEIEEIENQLQNLQDKAQQAKENAQNVQENANRILEKARTTSDPVEKANLQEKAYNILAGKDGNTSKAQYMSQYQQYLDQIDIIKSKLKIANKSFANFQDEINKLQNRIQEYKTADMQLDLNQDITTINSQISQLEGSISSSLTGLDEMLRQYNNTASNALDLLDDAETGFKRAHSNIDIKQIAQLFLADLLAERANIYSRVAMVNLTISQDMSFMAKMAETSIAGSIKSLQTQYAGKADSMFNSAIDFYSQADKEYQDMRFNPKCPVLKQRILTLLAKANLAKKFQKSDVYTKTSDTAKETLNQIYDCDENFTQTYLDQKVKAL